MREAFCYRYSDMHALSCGLEQELQDSNHYHHSLEESRRMCLLWKRILCPSESLLGQSVLWENLDAIASIPNFAIQRPQQPKQKGQMDTLTWISPLLQCDGPQGRIQVPDRTLCAWSLLKDFQPTDSRLGRLLNRNLNLGGRVAIDDTNMCAYTGKASRREIITARLPTISKRMPLMWHYNKLRGILMNLCKFNALFIPCSEINWKLVQHVKCFKILIINFDVTP